MKLDRFWRAFAIILALVIIGGVALITRYQYYTVESVFFRIDRWTGRMEDWDCWQAT